MCSLKCSSVGFGSAPAARYCRPVVTATGTTCLITLSPSCLIKITAQCRCSGVCAAGLVLMVCRRYLTLANNDRMGNLYQKSAALQLYFIILTLVALYCGYCARSITVLPVTTCPVALTTVTPATVCNNRGCSVPSAGSGSRLQLPSCPVMANGSS